MSLIIQRKGRRLDQRTSIEWNERMNILIFGATGLIGSAVTRAAVARGHQVHAIARSKEGAASISALGAVAIPGDMTKPEMWRDALEASDVVIQLAADFGGELGASEEIWVSAVVEAGKQRTSDLHVIYTGGCWLFPERTDPPLSEVDGFDPLPPFAYMVEHRARLLEAGLRITTVHPGMVWSETDGCTNEIRRSLERGEPIEVVGSPSVKWPLVHVEDLAELYVLALPGPISGSDVFGVSEPGVSVAEIIAEMEKRIGRVSATNIVSVEDAVHEMGDWAAGKARSQCIVSDLARTRLGWSPRRFLGSA
jgi:nucleoside-diphosphate-sugar epimerase